MMNFWYYYDAAGNRIGPVAVSTIKQKIRIGEIQPETIVENPPLPPQPAGSVKGMTFPDGTSMMQSPFMPPQSVPAEPLEPIPAEPMATETSAAELFSTASDSENGMYKKFCTNCGQRVYVQTPVCPYCGTDSTKNRKFCRECGGPIAPKQNVCLHCGVPVYSGGAGRKNKIIAGLLGIFFGSVGIHKFYLGKIGMGVLYMLTTIISSIMSGILGAVILQQIAETNRFEFSPIMILEIVFGILSVVPEFVGLIEGIIYLCTGDLEFQEKYVD